MEIQPTPGNFGPGQLEPSQVIIAQQVAVLKSNLRETNFNVGPVGERHSVNKTHLALLQSDDQRLRSDAFAEEPHAAQKVPVSHARTRER